MAPAEEAVSGNEPQSLIWGHRKGGGTRFEIRSPWDGEIIASGQGLADFSELHLGASPAQELAPLLSRLAAGIRSHREALTRLTQLETGFVLRDAVETVDGAIAYVEGFASHPNSQGPATIGYPGIGHRRIELRSAPYGTVAVILPQNAFLTIALTCLLNGFRAGNRMILRAPSQSAASASLLGQILEEIPELARSVALVVCSAKPFVDWFFSAPIPGLLHFLGGSRRADDLMSRGFASGKSVVIDGEGNVWAYVHPDYPVDQAADLLVSGAFRYNGQTCTSLNGAMVHPDIFAQVCERVAERAHSYRVGPVFDEDHAAWCLRLAQDSGGAILSGGERKGARLEPTVVTEPNPESKLVQEGVFGPVLWLARGDEAEFERRWQTNRYPLCAAVFQGQGGERWLERLPNLARLVLNGDPSLEDPFEFWGGYPSSAQHPVSTWLSKYRRTIQVDLPAS